MIENIQELKKHLELKEGRKRKAYPDQFGVMHIAVGHKLDAEQKDDELAAMGLEDELDDWNGFEISEEAIDLLLDIDIEDTLHGLRFSFTDEELEALDPQRFCALFNMAFQNGSCVKFPSMVKAVKEGDWQRASDEMLWSNGLKKNRRSAWYKQTPGRCQENADMMLKGSTTKTVVTEGVNTEVPEIENQYLKQLQSIEAKIDSLFEIVAVNDQIIAKLDEILKRE